MQAVIAEYLTKHLDSLSREEIDTLSDKFHTKNISDAQFWHHVAVYTIDSTFQEDARDVTQFLTHTYASDARIHITEAAKALGTFKTMLHYQDHPSLVDEDSIEVFAELRERERRSQYFAVLGAEMLWNAAVHDMNTNYCTTEQVVDHAQQAFKRAAQCGDETYKKLAQETSIFAQRLVEKRNKYFN